MKKLNDLRITSKYKLKKQYISMKVEEKYSIGELYEKVRTYDIVFTSEASIMSALNDRREDRFK